MTGFQRCLPVILGFEGGYVDNPADPGGATNRGITQLTYTTWRKRQGLLGRPVAEMTDLETQAIYYDNYWRAAGCDALELPVALVVFDSAVQHGVGKARDFLRDIGPHADALCNRRLGYYDGIVALHPNEAVFLTGWRNRITALRTAAQTFAADPTITPPPLPAAA